MTLLLDPQEPTEFTVEDVTFRIRVMTSREFARLVPAISELEKDFREDEVVLSDEGIARMIDILLAGLMSLDPSSGDLLAPEELDRIPFTVWPELWAEVLRVNTVSEEDRKN